MRVELTSIDEFCEELRLEAVRGAVFDKTVRVRIDRSPEQDEAITFQVGLWATAVVKRENADWLLEFGAVCGSDDEESHEGSTIAESWHDKIQEVADATGLVLRHGKIEIY